ncbi:hypothetical protein AVEN_160818-1 [Araneus ventricosus]|uniref:Endonuclease/exonuclease/phosphatase domain-containing protein n=1 Tax=Araneus ventricosus TaxID=182803 RepID=A0A4Y2J059_ARAVE|nr:hypothetical protein AVEN_160818-1 [Araneus ventricosus]
MWHNSLIVKLINFQFPDYLIKIIQRFLSDRKFQVKINQILSSVRNTQAGTTRSSSLSPTLCNIFNSDFPRNDKVLNGLFADDSAILIQACNYRPPHGRINTQEIDRIFNQSNKSYNSKHRAWSRGRSNTNGTIIHDHIASNNVVLQTPLEPTHFPYNHPSSRTLDFDIMKKISAGNASSHNDLSSDHNPVFFELILSNSPSKNTVLPTGKPTVKSFTIASQADNPKMDTTEDVGDSIIKFTCCITTAMNLSTKVQLIKLPFRQLPRIILDKMKIKNRLRKLYQQTFYPSFKREAYKLQKKIHKEIEVFDNNRWRNTIQGINPEENTLYDMNRKLPKKFIHTTPILGTDGMNYTALGKANAFR